MSRPAKLFDSVVPAAKAIPLSHCVKSVDSPEGRKRLSSFLHAQPFPHYELHPKSRGLLIRIEANGTRIVGRFVNRQFQTAKL